MGNVKNELRKAAEREFRGLTSVALFNNLYWWASGSQKVSTKGIMVNR